MFHLQLRQFPHNHCQFNLSDADLRSFLELWLRGDWLVVGQREWSPRRAKLTVVEAPGVEAAQLSMGRGWRHVERSGEDVTRRVLADASASLKTAPASAPKESGGSVLASSAGAGAGSEPRDSDVGGDLQVLLGEGSRAQELLEAWRRTAARFPERSPSECLALAERQLDSAASSR
jgi:hypothetical protein